MVNFPATGRISGYWIQGMPSFSPSAILKGVSPTCPDTRVGGWPPLKGKWGRGVIPTPPPPQTGCVLLLHGNQEFVRVELSVRRFGCAVFLEKKNRSRSGLVGGGGTPLVARHMGGGVPPPPLPFFEQGRPVHEIPPGLDNPKAELSHECQVLGKLFFWDEKRRLGIEEGAAGFEHRGDLAEEFFLVRDFVDNEDRKRRLEQAVYIRGKVKGVRLARMGFYPGDEALGGEVLADYRKHLFLEVGGDHRAILPYPFCERPGEKSRAAAEVEHPVAGFHISFRERIGPVEKAAEFIVQMSGVPGGEDVAGVGVSGAITGCHNEK